MKTYRTPFNIKLSLFILAMTIIVMIFWVNRIMINQLRSEARAQVGFLAKSYSETNPRPVGHCRDSRQRSCHYITPS